MPELNQQPFLEVLRAEINRNLSNELFGVSELADAMNMSRSNLLRKVKKETNLSVSQLISQERLARAMELLKTSQLTVTEVSQRVGFNSTSYFIKCFREYFGFPPGEAGKRVSEPIEAGSIANTPEKSHASEALPDSPVRERDDAVQHEPANVRPIKRNYIFWAVGVAVAVAGALAVGWHYRHREPQQKSIAVLPFKNESADSSNVYLINGLMDATLNNLQRIGNLNVVSRTTAEKYRDTRKSVPEMASEMNVEYFIEGSGQKIGNNILLNIQLIDATTDKHLWARQYRRESADIFDLQQEIANDIAREIQVIITPEELSSIGKRPTENVEAYEYFLKGKEAFYRSGSDDLKEAVPLLQKAIELDPGFAQAYAHLTMIYYYQDIFSAVKIHTAQIDEMSEKAIFYDPNSSESQLAKALSFAHQHRYDLAVSYLERALEYSPRSGVVLHFLSEFYSMHVPDPEKYLGYAVRKVETDLGADSTTRAFNYFHLTYALLQNGFYKESNEFMQKSLALDPKGFFAVHVKAYVNTIDRVDWATAKTILEEEYRRVPTRFDILSDIGMVNFMQRDFTAARRCYDSALAIMHGFKMDVLAPNYMYVGVSHQKTGDPEGAKYYFDQFKLFADKGQTIYKDLHLATYELHAGNRQKALELFTRFANEQKYFISLVLLIADDPMIDGIRNEKAFQEGLKEMNTNFWTHHKKLDEQWRPRFEKL